MYFPHNTGMSKQLSKALVAMYSSILMFNLIPFFVGYRCGYYIAIHCYSFLSIVQEYSAMRFVNQTGGLVVIMETFGPDLSVSNDASIMVILFVMSISLPGSAI